MCLTRFAECEIRHHRIWMMNQFVDWMAFSILNDAVRGLLNAPRQCCHCFGNNTNGTKDGGQLHRGVFRDGNARF